MTSPTWSRATLAAQAGGQIDEATGGVVGPWQPSTTFVRDEAYAPPASGDIYRRDQNPTVRESEHVLAALEGAAEARLFASGLAAIAAVMRTCGPSILVQRGTYYGTTLLAERLAGDGANIGWFDPADLSTLEAACAAHNPRLVMIETPSNPWLTVVSITEAALIAHAHGALLAVDSTTATPILTRPLEHGADIVMHSATKGLNGHSDVLAGALAIADPSADWWTAILRMRAMEGPVVSPFDAWLLTRGMRTVHLRVAESCRSALHLAHWLSAHEKVATVRYPGLPDHPRHTLAAVQMEGGFGPLLSFDVAGGAHEALAVAGGLRLIKRATSLGGVESLIEHRHSIEPTSTGMPPALLRLSVGVEAVEDLVADLAHALDVLP